MLFYHFAICSNGNLVEELGDVPLPDDRDAFAFAKQVIRECLADSDTKIYEGCTMDITESKREVGGVPL